VVRVQMGEPRVPGKSWAFVLCGSECAAGFISGDVLGRGTEEGRDQVAEVTVGEPVG
jgi:hypothetical protein